MNKNDVKKLLFSIRTLENQAEVNNMLGKIDMMTDEEIENKTKNFSKEQLEQFFKSKIENRTNSYFTKVNDFFEYGISGECVHLHLPGDFHKMFEKLGKVKASATIAKNLIDAATKINNQRNSGDSRLANCTSLYMISPIFYSPTFYPKILRNKDVRDNKKIETPIFKIFKLMGLETNTYTREELQNSEFVQNNKEAKLAAKNFGTNKDVGAAILSFEKFNSKKFQTRLKKINSILEKISEQSKEEKEER